MEYFGGFGLRQYHSDVSLAGIDADKTFGFELKNIKELTEKSLVFVQLAMLYTNPFGERKLRIFNMAYQVCANVNTYFKQVNVENYVQYMVK